MNSFFSLGLFGLDLALPRQYADYRRWFVVAPPGLPGPAGPQAAVAQQRQHPQPQAAVAQQRQQPQAAVAQQRQQPQAAVAQQCQHPQAAVALQRQQHPLSGDLRSDFFENKDLETWISKINFIVGD